MALFCTQRAHDDACCSECSLCINSHADANVGSAVCTSSHKFNPDSNGKGKMVAEDSLSSLSSREDEPDFDPVDSKDTLLNPFG